MMKIAKNLHRYGVLGINRRNIDYVMCFNPRRLYPLVDDKARTKTTLMEAGIAVPDLYGMIETQHDARHFIDIVAAYEDFVVKPAHGSQGDGILVISGKRKARYRTVGGDSLSQADLEHHISNTLSGQYSLGGNRDRALIEYRVKFDPIFERISYQGVPDVRIIVFRGIPVMAMVRLPTRMSGGKANLHQGAVGAGIDLATGMTLEGVLDDELVAEHPDTESPISGLQIPDWETMLALAAQCSDVTGLGYLGIDIVLDRDLGPLILELNARPGLNIQIANQRGLIPRLNTVADNTQDALSIDERVRFARERFAHHHASND